MPIKQHLFNGYSVAGETCDFYFAMQNLNRATIKYAAGMIKVGMKLLDVKALCENYLLENGVLCDETDRIKNDEWRRGLQMEEYLHKTLIDVAIPDMTFEELYYFIVKEGFLNLDFFGNLGHSIVKNKNDRIYIEKGNKTRLGDAAFFTFEPHIKRENGMYGYKKENIYCFKGNYLCEI